MCEKHCVEILLSTGHWMLSAGVYNEEVFASLDWVLDQAAQRNIKLIIPIEVCHVHVMHA